MAATVAKPGLIPRVIQEHSLRPVTNPESGAVAQAEEEAEPKVPPQHQRLKLNDFALVRTLGTGIALLTCRIDNARCAKCLQC